jgi:hypothetical protein
MTRRTTTNLVVDIVAFAAFVLLTSTGLVERYILPPGTGRFQSLWGLDRHQWGQVHFWIALFLMGVLAMHVVLHWKWIVCVVRGKKTEASGWRFAFGVVGFFGLIGLSIAPFLATVEHTSEAGRRRQQQQHESITNDGRQDASHGEIQGSMTLSEIEAATGISANVIIDQLGLPPDVSRDEKLGRLRREFNFEIDDVRELIQEEQTR